MALQLDLNDAQQQQIKMLFLEQSILRGNRMEQRKKQMENAKNNNIAKEERFKILNNSLDDKLDIRNKIKDILTQEQYEKWLETNRMMGKKKSMTRMPREKNQIPNN